MKLDAFNVAHPDEAAAALLACCHSRRWAQVLLSRRPFESLSELLDCADRAWRDMKEPDILEAFAAHPRIGDLDALRDKYSRATAEQGQVREADEQVLKALQRLNNIYETMNGFIFIVCASGKSAQEMCELLEQRLDNTRDQELENGALEQGKITALRMRDRFSD